MGFVGFYCSKCCQCRNFAKMNRVKVSVSISPFPCWRSQCASVTTLTQSVPVPGKPRLPPSLPLSLPVFDCSASSVSTGAALRTEQLSAGSSWAQPCRVLIWNISISPDHLLSIQASTGWQNEIVIRTHHNSTEYFLNTFFRQQPWSWETSVK